jgi:hypothetical protein
MTISNSAEWRGLLERAAREEAERRGLSPKRFNVKAWSEEFLGDYSNHVYKKYGEKAATAAYVERWSEAVSLYLGTDYKAGWLPEYVEAFIARQIKGA